MSSVGILAYIDPLSGTILLQLIVAGVLGSMAFFHRAIARVLRVVFRRKAESDNQDD